MSADTTTRNEARRIYRGDWDTAGVTTVHLPGKLAERLLEAANYTGNRLAGYTGPDGSHYWHLEEALAIELAAQALAA